MCRNSSLPFRTCRYSSLALNLSYLGDLTSWIFLRNGHVDKRCTLLQAGGLADKMQAENGHCSRQVDGGGNVLHFWTHAENSRAMFRDTAVKSQLPGCSPFSVTERGWLFLLIPLQSKGWDQHWKTQKDRWRLEVQKNMFSQRVVNWWNWITQSCRGCRKQFSFRTPMTNRSHKGGVNKPLIP